jgi:bifunctional aspartokinase / homoserine dehydrogenase 1
MTDSMRDRAERIELRRKINSDVSTEGAAAYSQESALTVRSAEHGHRADSPLASTEPLGRYPVRSSRTARALNPRPDGTVRTPELYPAHVLHPHTVRDQLRGNLKKPLRVMKFGGTSVGDPSCIQKVVDIVRTAVSHSDVVVVVSAMSGVTNKLVEAAKQSATGNHRLVTAIFEELRQRHETAASVLIHSPEVRQSIGLKLTQIIQEGESVCQQIILQQELTPRLCDAVSGMGERLSAPLVAAALAEQGIASEAIEATELVVTDSCHGAAEPFMELTRERCVARLRPLMLQGVVAVVTGFIGATVEGVPTTLGRNSSDYSGTIMGAALDADEVTLWTDVDGILTADPRLVPEASSILEMSYREASDLADLGAKVLHPKTLHALMQRGIPLAIRNTFAPDRPGTKITPAGSSEGTEPKALTATNNVALVTVHVSKASGMADILRRTLATVAAVPAEARLTPQSSSPQSEVCIVIPSSAAELTVEALRREFAQDMAHDSVRDITVNPSVAIVTIVGGEMLGEAGLAARTLGALQRANLHVLGSAPGSHSSFAFVVAPCDLNAAVVTAHRELQLSAVDSEALPRTTT